MKAWKGKAQMDDECLFLQGRMKADIMPCQLPSKLMFSLPKNSVCAILHGKMFKVTTFTSRKKFISMVFMHKRNCVFDPFDCLGLHFEDKTSYKLCSICRILKLPFQDWRNLFFFQEPFIALVLLIIAVCQKTAGSTIVISYFLAHWQLQCSWASSKMYKNNCCVYIPRKL